MGIDYFAHAVWGVIPEGPFIDRFIALVDEEMTRRSKEPGDDASEEEYEAFEEWDNTDEGEKLWQITRHIQGEYPDLMEELRGQYSSPEDAELYWTGSMDNRPGRCNTDSEVWVFGIGLMGMHKPRRCSEVWLQQARYHT
jgi:hypothetical protein